MAEISFTGGARVGWLNASWPFAKLKIAASKLTISSLGRYDFSPEQVVTIERYGSIPILASGIRIKHNRIDYPKNIVFWCVGNRNRVLSSIEQRGFVPKGQPVLRVSGFPIRWPIVVALVVVWNVLILLDLSLNDGPQKGIGLGGLVAMLLALGFSTALKKSSPIQEMVLRTGHQIGEIKYFLTFLQILLGLFSIAFGCGLLLRAFGD